MHRISFCNHILSLSARQLGDILYTDECKFDRAGVFNIHNQHVWSDENPHAIKETNIQRQFSVNLWAGIIGNRLIGPIILPDIVNGANYLSFLQNILPDLLEDLPLEVLRSMIFQHDGCPAHFQRDVRGHLDEAYPARWIGRGGPVPWPARSPDLTPLDFYLWGRMKEIVYFDPVSTKEILLQRIEEASQIIRNEITIDITTTEVVKRARLCPNTTK